MTTDPQLPPAVSKSAPDAQHPDRLTLEQCRAEVADLHAEIADLRDRLDGDAWGRLVRERDDAREQHAATQRAWNTHELAAHPGCRAERATFTIRPAGEPDDVTVALHNLGHCAVCGNEVPAGAFAVRIDDPEVHGWAHESCARPQNPARPALNAEQTRSRS